MGFLELAACPISDFTRAIISFWVRIPQESIDNAGYLPLASFGAAQTQFSTVRTDQVLATATNSIVPTMVYSFTGASYAIGDAYQVAPTTCAVEAPPGALCSFQFNVQLLGRGKASGIYWTTGAINADAILHTYTNNPGIPVDAQLAAMVADPATYIPFDITYQGQDVTETVLNTRGDSFGISPNIGLEAGRWHHILISFDIGGTSTGVGTQGVIVGGFPAATDEKGSLAASCRVWAAIDDVDYSGDDLGLPTSFFGLGQNDWPSNISILAAATQAPPNGGHVPLGSIVAPAPRGEELAVTVSTWAGYAAPSYVYEAQSVPLAGAALGIPAATDFIDSIGDIDMAEFQMWVGKTLDAGNASMRRLFIDDHGKPVDPKVAAETLGEPDILLHGSDRWVNGQNLGSIAGTSPIGDFTPVGTIVPFKPDPSLHGPQTPTQSPQPKPQTTRRRAHAVRLEKPGPGDADRLRHGGQGGPHTFRPDGVRGRPTLRVGAGAVPGAERA